MGIVQKLGFVLAAWLVAACDPPCKSYWSVACERCGESSTGCESARRFSKEQLEAPGACGEASVTLNEVLGEEGGKDVVCSLPADGPPPKSVRGAWSCDGVRIELGLSAVKVGDKSFGVVQFSSRWLNLKLSESEQTSCHVLGQADRLSLDCATPLGALPAEPVACTRPK